MTIVEAIRCCHSDFEVYELLNAYIEAARLAQSSDSAGSYPIENTAGVIKQMQILFVALEVNLRRLDDHLRLVIKEALYVFSTALDRLRSLADSSDKSALGVSEVSVNARICYSRN
jgi:hypothetical protein